MHKPKQKNAPNQIFKGGIKNVIPVPKDKTNVKQVANFMANLIKYNRSLFKKELEDLNMARAHALNVENPRRYYLTQIYRDIELDMFLKGMINQRIGRITNKKFKITLENGDTDEKLTKQMKKSWFKKFRRYFMESKFHGFRVPYLFIDPIKNRMDCKAVWPENVVPELGLILKHPFDTDGYSFREPPLSDFCIGIGEPEDLGLFESLAIGFILKKHSWQSWDEFEERFSIPMIIAKTASEDTAVQNEILSWLEDLGAGGNALFPMDTEIDYKESKHVDAFQVFSEKIKALNAEAAILINGQQESSNNTGSRAKTESLIKNTTDQITEDDKSDFEDIANDDLLPMLRDYFGWDIKDGHRFEWDDADSLPITEVAKVMESIDKAGFIMDEKDIQDKTGFKIIGRKSDKQPEPVEDPNNPNPKKKTDAGAKKPKIDDAFMRIVNMHYEITDLITDHHDHGEEE